MRIAIPVWQSCISPLLDTARLVRLYRVGANGDTAVGGEFLLPEAADEKAAFIAGNADVVICAALSREMESSLKAKGLTIHPWVMGEIDTIANAYARGKIRDYEHSMPGCRGKGRGRCGRNAGGMGRGGRRCGTGGRRQAYSSGQEPVRENAARMTNGGRNRKESKMKEW